MDNRTYIELMKQELANVQRDLHNVATSGKREFVIAINSTTFAWNGSGSGGTCCPLTATGYPTRQEAELAARGSRLPPSVTPTVLSRFTALTRRANQVIDVLASMEGQEVAA
ncbi:MAG: hypothetical protein ACRC8D_07200 [Aeromonas sp.]